MSTVGQFVRRCWRELLTTAFAVALAVWWLLPAHHVDGAGLAAAEVGDFVEVTLDRIDIFSRQHPDGILALGWVDDRLLLLRTNGGPPDELTVWGRLREPQPATQRWLARKRKTVAQPYPLILDISWHGHRAGRRVRAFSSAILLLLVWGYRLYRWRRPKRTLALDGPVPRGDDVVRAVMRRHAVLRYVVVFVLLVFTAIPLLVAAVSTTVVPTELWLTGGGALILCAIVSPIWLVPFAIWVWRSWRRLARVVRHGDWVAGHIVEVTTRGRRTLTRYKPYATKLTIQLPAGERSFTYRTVVPHDAMANGAPGWARPGVAVHAVTLADAKLAIVVAPDGDDLLARRDRRDRILPCAARVAG